MEDIYENSNRVPVLLIKYLKQYRMINENEKYLDKQKKKMLILNPTRSSNFKVFEVVGKSLE